MTTTEVYCPKCKKYIKVKIEYGKSIVQMLKNQHKCSVKCPAKCPAKCPKERA